MFAPVVAPLGAGEIANVPIDANGGATAHGSTFTGGSAAVTAVPEPATLWLVAITTLVMAGFGSLGLRAPRH